MRDFREAKALVGSGVEFTAPGRGSRRLVHFEDRGGSRVAARVSNTDVVVFSPVGVSLFTGGYVTQTTFEAIAAALNVPRAEVGTVNRIPKVLGHTLREGLRVDYMGRVLDAGSTLHLAAGRKQKR